MFVYDRTNSKVLAYVTGSADGAVLSQEANATDMSSVATWVRAEGW